MASLRLLIVLLAATLGLAVAPAAASAQAPPNDDYLDSTRINQPGELLQDDFQDLATNTDEATEQVDPDLFGDAGGSFPEITQCNFQSGREVYYGKTVWWDIFPDVDGEVTITAAGFDAVIGFVPYDPNSAEPFYDEWFCADDPALTTTESATFTVEAGRPYSIQIGGYAGEDGTQVEPASGDLEFIFHFEPDSDGDGVLDEDDSCPGQAGKPSLQGCPDDDNDNIRNSEDSCPTVAGEGRFGGCPDADGDSVPEPPDQCPGVTGNLPNGCVAQGPRPDVDSDNVFDDGPDRCVGEDSSARDANRNGCLDLQLMNPRWIFNPDSYFTRRGGRVVLLGLEIERFGVRNVPRGARVVVTCTRRACGRMVKRGRGRRVLFGQLRGDDFRAGVKLTIRVTAPGYVGAARVYTIQRNDYVRTDRCLMPGSSRLRTSCSPVR